MHTEPAVKSTDPARSCFLSAIVHQGVVSCCNLLSLQCSVSVPSWVIVGYQSAARRYSTLEPTSRRAGFELRTYWRDEPGAKGMLLYGTFGVLASWRCMPCLRCRLPPCLNEAAHSSPHPGVLDLSCARTGALSLARRACCRMVL
jgi:hypothetical protein